MKKVLFVLLLVVASSIATAFAVRGYNKRIVSEQMREAEAALAEARDLHASVEITQRELDRVVVENHAFAIQVAMLTEDLEQVGATEVAVREVTRWRTNSIEVPVDRIIEVPIDRVVTVEGDCPFVLPESFAFEVEGRDARVDTSLGNTFATGVVELYRTRPGPRVLLGESEWRSDLTELFVRGDDDALPALRRTLMIGYVFDDDAYTLKYAQTFSRRFGVFVGGVVRSRGIDFDYCDASTCSSSTRATFEAGLTFAF